MYLFGLVNNKFVLPVNTSWLFENKNTLNLVIENFFIETIWKLLCQYKLIIWKRWTELNYPQNLLNNWCLILRLYSKTLNRNMAFVYIMIRTLLRIRKLFSKRTVLLQARLVLYFILLSSRSASLVIAFLIIKKKLSIQESITLIR